MHEMGIFYHLMVLLGERAHTTGPKYELVVIDMPATGHTLALTELPQILTRLVPRGPVADAIREGQAILNNEQEIIENQNIQALIDEALKENNYRLAIRYYYLLLLQTLSKKDLIDWQLQKTNHDYIHEIQDGGIKTSFSKVTRIYDFIWYGSFEVDEEAFAKAEKEFKNLQAHI